MGSIEKYLLPDEQIIYRTKKHVILFLGPVLFTIAIFFFHFNSNPLVAKVAFLPALAAAATGLNAYLMYITSEFAVTNKRILMQEGFFFKHRNEMRLASIANITVNQNLFGQILNFGTVIIHSFGGDPDPFTQIAFPNDFQQQVQIQLDKIAR